ncbi:MAG: HesA/MoeB/ThiF family protein [Desulfobacterales bacterium]|nr:HesA/MoeB/ThiF family protein [Desulfobacterales bacterium]
MLTEEETRRYSRQVQLPEIGPEGQVRIASGEVLIAGLGGLGSIAAYYLAAAGVGRLKIVDRDRVAFENLNRQILHATADLGRPKSKSAYEKLSRLNPHCHIEAAHASIDAKNVDALLGDCTVVVDASDNRETRQVLNRASVERGLPFVFGGISGWEGMTATFIPDKGPCFGCLFPPGAATLEAGPPPALGPTAGVVASLQCLETLRLLIGLAPQLAGRLLRFSGATMEFRMLPIARNPHCPVCGHPRRNPVP